MPEVWTGEIVKQMHLNNVSANEIAKEAGVTSAYVSMLLHSKRTPDGAQEMLEAALDAIIKRKTANLSQKPQERRRSDAQQQKEV